MSALDGLSADEARGEIVRAGKADDAEMTNRTSYRKKALWVLNDKNSAEKPVTDFKSWTERVKSLLELAWWLLLFFSTASQMEKSEEDKDAGPISILEEFRIRKLLAPRSGQISAENTKVLKVLSLEIR
ncbi:uncharacterized protein RSE6_03393 [Rhynchosporium secalis]|uniref:Uncharacterized protein n=2 Tax=Rhynchosporium TaxID=38037 RepID=A0A1E1M2N2_RHYSE|nr:uncharacterized protein RSE6_03393 [Rhynchosporium secalis]